MLSSNKVEAISTIIYNFYPDAKIKQKGKMLNKGCREISFETESVVGSFLREVFNQTTSFTIKPVRTSLQVEVTFN